MLTLKTALERALAQAIGQRVVFAAPKDTSSQGTKDITISLGILPAENCTVDDAAAGTIAEHVGSALTGQAGQETAVAALIRAHDGTVRAAGSAPAAFPAVAAVLGRLERACVAALAAELRGPTVPDLPSWARGMANAAVASPLAVFIQCVGGATQPRVPDALLQEVFAASESPELLAEVFLKACMSELDKVERADELALHVAWIKAATRIASATPAAGVVVGKALLQAIPTIAMSPPSGNQEMSWFLLNPLLKFSAFNRHIANALETEAYGSHPTLPQSRENVSRMKIRLTQVRRPKSPAGQSLSPRRLTAAPTCPPTALCCRGPLSYTLALAALDPAGRRLDGGCCPRPCACSAQSQVEPAARVCYAVDRFRGGSRHWGR